MTDEPWLDCMDGFKVSDSPTKPVVANDLTPRQRQVLEAVVDLMRGGMDMEEIFFCYKTISDYVRNSTINPD
jgi:DNA-binding NarL/FixJ family response regulator